MADRLGTGQRWEAGLPTSVVAGLFWRIGEQTQTTRCTNSANMRRDFLLLFHTEIAMKIGLYSITYRGVWYRGEPVNIFELVRLAKQQGWEGLELDAERPHAAPMDLRRRPEAIARSGGETGIELCAVSPNCDLSSPVPVQREAMICYVRECIKLAHDLGSPICKIFAAWRGITIYDGLATYDELTAITSTDSGRATAAAWLSSRCANSARWRRTTASCWRCRIMVPTS